MKFFYHDLRIAAALVAVAAVIGSPNPLPWTHEPKAVRLAKARAHEESLGKRQDISAESNAKRAESITNTPESRSETLSAQTSDSDDIKTVQIT